MPLSSDPRKRARQLANLRPGAGGGDRGLARAQSHGAYADIAAAELDAEVKKVYEALAADAPVRAPDGGLPREDTLAVTMLAEAMVRLKRITGFLIAQGLQRKDGSAQPALDLELRVRNHALDLARELGMTPKSRAALGVDLVRAATAGDRLEEHLARRYGGAGATATEGEVVDVDAPPIEVDGEGSSG